MSFRAFVLVAVTIAAGSLTACNKKSAEPAAGSAAGAPAAKVEGSPTKIVVGQKAHCPVTGEEFVVAETTKQVEHQGKFYAFCCPECEPSFTKDPAKYVKN